MSQKIDRDAATPQGLVRVVSTRDKDFLGRKISQRPHFGDRGEGRSAWSDGAGRRGLRGDPGERFRCAPREAAAQGDAVDHHHRQRHFRARDASRRESARRRDSRRRGDAVQRDAPGVPGDERGERVGSRSRSRGKCERGHDVDARGHIRDARDPPPARLVRRARVLPRAIEPGGAVPGGDQTGRLPRGDRAEAVALGVRRAGV